MTPDERAASIRGQVDDGVLATWRDLDPDQWPHTPPLHVFRALMDEDDNTWWRAGSGHGLNAYEAAVERLEDVEELLAMADRGGSVIIPTQSLRNALEDP